MLITQDAKVNKGGKEGKFLRIKLKHFLLLKLNFAVLKPAI